MENSRKYLDMIEGVYAEAKQATIDLLKTCGDKCFIALGDWEDCCRAKTGYDVNISIYAIGLDEKGELCIAAMVDIGYGFCEDDFTQDWSDTSGFYSNCYPDFYRFVADNLDKAMTKAEADEIVNGMWEEDE